MQHQRLEFIDALRGYAILGVLLTHAGSLLKLSGTVRDVIDACGTGVLLFFVISAFTIFMTLDRAEERERHLFSNFFIKRGMRLVPIYWLGIAFYTLVYGLASRGWRAGPELWHYPLHITLTNLLHPETSSSVVPGGWSISCEAMFYLTVPLWFLMLRTWKSALLFLIASVVLGQVAIHLLRMGLDAHLPTLTAKGLEQYWYRSFPSQLGVFGMGIFVYRLLQAGLPILDRLTAPTINLAVLGLGSAIWLAEAVKPLPYIPHQYVFALAYGMIAIALAKRPWRLLVHGPIQFVGRVSFSAYIVHFFVLYQLYLHVPLGSGLMRFVLLSMLATPITLALAYASFRFIEQPTTRLAKQWIRQREARLQPALAADTVS